MNCHRQIVQWLLERGADINSTDSHFGATPAGWAIEYLREMGGHLAIELDDLAYATRLGDTRWVNRFLKRFPSRRHARDREGTPFQKLARESANYGHYGGGIESINPREISKTSAGAYPRPSFGCQCLPCASQCRSLNAPRKAPITLVGTPISFIAPNMSSSRRILSPLAWYSFRNRRESASFFRPATRVLTSIRKTASVVARISNMVSSSNWPRCASKNSSTSVRVKPTNRPTCARSASGETSEPELMLGERLRGIRRSVLFETQTTPKRNRYPIVMTLE